MLILNLSAFFFLISIQIQITLVVSSVHESTKQSNHHYATEGMTTPSPEWLKYQRERFGNTKDIESLKKLLDPASQLLKDNAQTIDPISRTVSQNEKKQSATTSQKDEAHAETSIEKLQKKDESNKQVELNNDDKENNNDDQMRSNEENINIFSYIIEGVQYPSWRGFINFLKSAKRKWVKQSRLSIEQKIHKLKRLKNKMMHLIEDRFNMIWAPKVYMRRKRGLLEESNLNFPPEAALISINFLTFAVFLIKLVLQVVHIIKSKHYTFSGLGFSPGDNMATFT